MRALGQDLRYALRGLRRTPAFTAITLLSLGLAVGATTMIFTWMDGLVLRPFPAVQEQERLVRIFTHSSAGVELATSHPDYLDWRDEARSFDGIAAYSIAEFGLRGGGADEQADRVWGMYASDNYFQVLGVRPHLGRAFLPEEGVLSGDPRAAVLGYELWQRRFGADPEVVGTQVLLNNEPFTVVGVAAPRFGGTIVGLRLELWVPTAALPVLEGGVGRLEWRGSRSLDLIGRLAPGVTLPQAHAELAAIGAERAREHGQAEGFGPAVRPFDHDGGAQQMLRPVLFTLLAVSGLVLLIACANVANLLLARAVSRRREIGIRLAIGASRLRLLRQLLTESFLLALIGGAIGLAIAVWGRDLLMWFIPPSQFPVEISLRVSQRVLALTAGLTLLVTLLFGLVPAWRASRAELGQALRGRDAGVQGGRSSLRSGLVVAQVALALVTLVCAGLFLRSLRALHDVDPGFRDPAQVLLVTTNLRLAGYEAARGEQLVEQLVEQATSLPGVQAAAAASSVPLGFGGWSSFDFAVEGYTSGPTENMTSLVNRISSGYFAALGIPLISGRTFVSGDRAGAADVVIVNQTFAQRFFPDGDAVGGRLRVSGRSLTIAGVVADGRYSSLLEPTPPFLYLPLAQWPSTEVTLHLRTDANPFVLVAPLRQEFTRLDPALPFLEPRTLEQHMGAAVVLHRMGASLLTGFGTLALILAVIGLYGVMTYTVAQQTREIGIRMALGAAQSRVVSVFVGRGARLAAVGLVIGLGAGYGLSRLLRTQLFGVAPGDPLTFAAAATVLLVVALAATYLPARRAARVDPMITLRAE